MSEPIKPPPFRRAPAGVQVDKPILMRLLPAERKALQQHARRANSSMAGFARDMTLRGMSSYERELTAKNATCVPRHD